MTLRYLTGGFTTLPEFLETRFDRRVRRATAVLFLLGYGLVTIPSVLYSGSLAVLQLFYHQHLSGKASGGGASSASAFGHSGSYDFFARMDLDALVGWSGGRVLLHVRGLYDRNVNADVGAIGDPIDDADFDEPIFVDQLWLQQSLLDERLRLRIGLVEQQTLFDRNAYANSEDRQFLNAALDNDLLVPLPGGLSAAVILAPVPWAEVAAGTSDADNVPRDVGFGTAFDGIESLSWYVEASFASPFQRSSAVWTRWAGPSSIAATSGYT